MLDIIIACVDYSDFLRLTLAAANNFGGCVHVVTTEHDYATRNLAKEHGVDCIRTDRWTADGAVFNKGAALNHAIRTVQPKDWLLLLDADILIRPPPKDAFHLLDNGNFYGVRRRAIATEADWERCVADDAWDKMPMMRLPPVVRRRLWGSRPSANPIGVQGYFQMWHHGSHRAKLYGHRTASKYDVKLALQWPDNRRKLLPYRDYAVMHLGQARVNWAGRTTEPWRSNLSSASG